jgi:hypothetical protein
VSGTATTLVKNIRLYNLEGQDRLTFRDNSLDLNPKGQHKLSEYSELGPTDGLVAYYPLNGNAKDYAGGNDGTVNGAVVSSGLGQSAYSFDGVDDYIHIGEQLTLDKNSSTLSFWMNANIMANMNLFGITSTTYSINLIEFRQTSFYCETNNNCGFFSSPTINPISINEWNHFVVVFNSGHAYWYQNGEYIGETPDYGSTNCAAPAITKMIDNTYIRYIGSGGYSQSFDGKIQDVRIYNKALTDEEVNILYKMTNPNEPERVMQDSKGTIYVKGELNEVDI